MQVKCPLELKTEKTKTSSNSKNMFSKTFLNFKLTPKNQISERTGNNTNPKIILKNKLFTGNRLIKISSPCSSKPILFIKKRSKTPQLFNTSSSNASINKDEVAKDTTEQYIFGKILGIGSYAVVKEAVKLSSHTKYAAKIYEKIKLLDPHKKRNVKKEIMIMQSLHHPNIIKMKETIDTYNQIVIIMDYIGGMSLHHYLKSKLNRHLPEPEAKKIFGQVLSAVEYCHSLNIAHRDIKLENILIDKTNVIKLIDFGFSTFTSREKKNTVFCGTPSYMAPEIVSRRDYFATSADVWALGVLLFVLLTGSYPFKGKTDQEVYKNILAGNFEFPTQMPSCAKSLIRKMFNLDSTKRPTCSQIKADEWLQTRGVFEASNKIVEHELEVKVIENISSTKILKMRENKEN